MHLEQQLIVALHTVNARDDTITKLKLWRQHLTYDEYCTGKMMLSELGTTCERLTTENTSLPNWLVKVGRPRSAKLRCCDWSNMALRNAVLRTQYF
jgi:hypothetical protein